LGTHLKQGANKLELKREGTGTLPFSIAMEYRTSKPASSTQAKVGLQTVLERTQAKLGESVRMNVTLTNKTGEGQPMTMARVQLPGGLTFQNWQLKELREKGLIAFYETRAREVNLYLRQMLPNQTVQIPLDLVAFAPGQYTSQASTAYLYYTDEHKVWVEPTSIRIEP
ncbi:MAG TPA: A-macroglobulin complement component, partial [Pseudomonadota bacterium]|nr:A-macroglobulin complement component [Pseudomonadota bacterium]